MIRRGAVGVLALLASIILAGLLRTGGNTGAVNTAVAAALSEEGPEGTLACAPAQTSGTLTAVQVAAAARAAATDPVWQAQLPVAVSVAKAESGFNPAVVNSIGASGLWQILRSAHPALFTRFDYADPLDNARMAYVVWLRAGRSWQPWEAYTRGMHTQFLGEATAAVAGGESECRAAPVVGGTLNCPPTGLPQERGLQPYALAVLRCVNKNFGRHTYHGVGPRANQSDHPSGRAVDIMIENYQSVAGIAHGNEIAAWVQANAAKLGVDYIIWRKAIWYPGDAVSAWETMADRGSDTANHLDHPHVSVR